MADFYLNPPPQRNWFAPIAGGMELAGNLQDQGAKRNWFNQQTQQVQEERGAVKQFGQTGDTKALMGIDPERAMKLKAWAESQPPENLADISKASAFVTSIAPTINSKSWPGIRGELMKSYPKVPQDALPPENANDQQLFQFANATKILAAQVKEYDPNYKLKEWETKNIKLPVAQARVAQLGASAAHSQASIEQGWAKIKTDKETGAKGGPYNQLLQFHSKIRPDEEPTEENLQNLFVKFSKSGVNMAQGADMKVIQQAMNNVSKTEGYKDLNLSKPEDQAKADAMIDREIGKMKGRLGGGDKGGGKPVQPAKGLQNMTTDELRQAIQRLEGQAQ